MTGAPRHAQGKNESLRARAILRSLVPLSDLEGVLSLPFTLRDGEGEDASSSDMPAGRHGHGTGTHGCRHGCRHGHDVGVGTGARVTMGSAGELLQGEGTRVLRG